MSKDTLSQDTAPHAGVVIDVKDGQATIRFPRSKMCEHCGACISIGESELEMRVPNVLDAKVGDRVTVSLAPRRVVQASFLAYAIPLCLLLVGVFLGSRVSDGAALVFGLVGCGCGYGILRLLEKRRNLKATFLPQMTEILLPELEPDGDGEMEE